MKESMVPIDQAGRIVLPKQVRDELAISRRHDLRRTRLKMRRESWAEKVFTLNLKHFHDIAPKSIGSQIPAP